MKPLPKQMLIQGQNLKFANTPQVDAEGQAVIREYQAQVPMGPQSGNAGGGGVAGATGMIPAVVQYSTTAGQLAESARAVCKDCKHYDVKAWRSFVQHCTGPAATKEDRETIRTFANRVAMAGYGFRGENDEHDVDKTVMGHGVCHILSDIVEQHFGRDPFHWPVVPWREEQCPDKMNVGPGRPPFEIVTAKRPFGFYEPKNRDADKAGTQVRDAILNAARGK